MPVALVAGGSGFIGSHLTEYLLAQGLRVVVIDSRTMGRKDGLALLSGHPRLAYIQYDLNQGIPAKIEGADYIFNLAAEELHLYKGSDSRTDTVSTNALTSRNLLELAVKSGAKIVVASSINVYRGILSATSLNNYFGKTEEEERSFSYFEAKRFTESLAWQYHKEHNVDVRIVRLGEVYGPGMDLGATGNLGRFIESLLAGSSFLVYGEGLEKEYYCYVSDVIEGIVKALFRSGTEGNIYPLIDLTPVTVLELAYLIKSFALPGTQIVFKPKLDDFNIPEIRTIDGRIQKDLKWKSKISLKEGIKLTLDYFGFNRGNFPAKIGAQPERWEGLAENFIPPGRLEQEKRRVPLFSTSKFRRPRLSLPNFGRTYKKRLGIFVGVLFTVIVLVFGLPTVIILYHTGFSFWEAKSAEKNFRDLKVEKTLENLESVSFHVARVGKAVRDFPFFTNGELSKLLDSVSYFSQAALLAAQGAKPLSDNFLRLGFGHPESGLSSEKIEAEIARLSEARRGFGDASDFIDLATASLKEVRTSSLPAILSDKIPTLSGWLSKTRVTLHTLNLITKMLPTVLGLEEERNYLLLFQNSNELRATGGFIGSVGTLKLKKGRIEQIKVIDVYDLDGQIDDRQIKVNQPEFLSDNLETSYLHLRDANFSPSFPESAQRIQNLYTQVTDESLDGILAIDLATIEGLLRITGPIFLPTYNETVSEKNIFERAQFHSEASFFPGSAQKKTFLSLVTQQLIDTVFSLDKKRYLGLVQELLTLLAEKHILIHIPDEQTTITQLEWDGRIRQTGSDYLMTIDTNVGSNKSNYFITRSLEYQLERANREGEYNAELRIKYKHDGKTDTWPGGPYKNYLRVYVPKKSALLSALISESGSGESAGDITNRIEIGEESGKTVFATTITVETGGRKNLILSYIIPQGIVPDNLYKLMIQKQPGTVGDDVTLKFRLPFGASFQGSTDRFKLLGDTVQWQGRLNVDQVIEIPLKPGR